MDTELVKQGNENSRSSSVIIDVKDDPATGKDYYKEENCQNSQSFVGSDGVGTAEMNINGNSINTSGESSRGDKLKMCRICHLANWENSKTEVLIQLGCGCKNELGASHHSCAQTWFKLKGNR